LVRTKCEETRYLEYFTLLVIGEVVIFVDHKGLGVEPAFDAGRHELAALAWEVLVP
jgi:hypothetical protein